MALSSSVFEERVQSVRRRRGRKSGRASYLRYAGVEGSRSTKARCREPDTAISFASIAENSSRSDSSGGVCDCVTYSFESVLFAVRDVTSATTCQEYVNGDRNENVRTRFTKNMVVHPDDGRTESARLRY